MPPSPFAVAGMASTSGSLTHSSSLTHSHNHNQGHAPALPSWGGDLSQRASHYQPGYLMVRIFLLCFPGALHPLPFLAPMFSFYFVVFPFFYVTRVFLACPLHFHSIRLFPLLYITISYPLLYSIHLSLLRSR